MRPRFRAGGHRPGDGEAEIRIVEREPESGTVARLSPEPRGLAQPEQADRPSKRR